MAKSGPGLMTARMVMVATADDGEDGDGGNGGEFGERSHLSSVFVVEAGGWAFTTGAILARRNGYGKRFILSEFRDKT